MIRHQRFGRAKVGKGREGLKFAKEIADFINTKYAPVSVQVYTEVFGEYNTIYWHTDHDDLSTLEEAHDKLIADPEYLAILNKGSDIFVEGTLQDKLLKSV